MIIECPVYCHTCKGKGYIQVWAYAGYKWPTVRREICQCKQAPRMVSVELPAELLEILPLTKGDTL